MGETCEGQYAQGSNSIQISWTTEQKVGRRSRNWSIFEGSRHWGQRGQRARAWHNSVKGQISSRERCVLTPLVRHNPPVPSVSGGDIQERNSYKAKLVKVPCQANQRSFLKQGKAILPQST